MFCPTCGELGYPQKGDGETYYHRVESSINQGWVWWQKDKPVLDDYNSDGSRKGNEKGQSKRGSSDYKTDYREWKNLEEDIPPFNSVEIGEELLENGVMYLKCNNYLCNYYGPVEKLDIGGKEIDIEDFTSSLAVETQEYAILSSNDQLRAKTSYYHCPKCGCSTAYIDSQNQEFGEVRVTYIECTYCGHGWQEH